VSELLAVRSARLGSVPPVTTDPEQARAGAPVPDDEEVGRRFAAGDEQALRIAYERWAGQVHGMAVRAFGPGPDAEDVTQQTFVSAWTGRAGYRPERGSLPGWLVGVARHKIADTWARRDKQRREAEAASTPWSPTGSSCSTSSTSWASRSAASSSWPSSRTSPTPRSPPAPGCRSAP